VTTVKALRVNADMTTEVIDLERGQAGYAQLYDAVCGYIEYVSLCPTISMVVNEEGKLRDMHYNDIATGIWAAYYGLTDRILGNAVLVGPSDAEGEATDLSPAVIHEITKYAVLIKEIREASVGRA